MKFINGQNHICADCGTDPCEYHDCDLIIDGWDAEYLDKKNNEKGGYYRIKKCPHFTDGSDCQSCANHKKCKMLLPYGEECKFFTRRAKKSDRSRMVDELKELSMSMTHDEVEAVYNFIIGIKHGDPKLEYAEVEKESKERIARIKHVRKFGKGKK